MAFTVITTFHIYAYHAPANISRHFFATLGNITVFLPRPRPQPSPLSPARLAVGRVIVTTRVSRRVQQETRRIYF